MPPANAPEPVDSFSSSRKLEILKFRLSLVLAVSEKLLIALLIVIAGYALNRALESYKADLQRQLTIQKSLLDQQLEVAKLDNSRKLFEAQTEQNRALENLRQSQQAQLEAIRGAQAQQLEAFRAVTASRSSLAQRRITAYETVYNRGVETSAVLAIISDPRTDLQPETAPQRRRGAIVEFTEVCQKNRLFLSDHVVGKIDQFLKGVPAERLVAADPQALEQFRAELERFLFRLQKDLRNDLDLEQRHLGGAA